MIKGKEKLDLTNGSIGKTLFHLSTPIIIINLLRMAYNIGDTFWLGQLSNEALAAIGFGFPLIFLFISLGMGVAVAGSVLVAQFEGGGNEKMVNFSASQTLTFSFIVSLIFGLIGFVAAEDLLILYGASEKVVSLGVSYLQIIFLGLSFMFGFAVFIALMRGYGDTRTPMFVMLFSIVLNVLLDPFLIFGWSFFPKLGIEGAAIATIFCRSLAFLIGLGMLLRGWKGLKISPSKMIPDLSFLQRLLKIGFPASIGATGRSVSVNVLVAIVGMFSTSVIAGYQVGTRIILVLFFSAMSVSRGVSTMTGQNLGAGNFERAEKVNYIGAKYLFLILTGIGIVLFLFPKPFVSVFTNDGEIVAIGGEFLRYTALSIGFIGIMRVFAGGFRGSGKTLTAATISIITLGIIRVPTAFTTSRFLGPTGIWMAFPISNILGATIAYFWFRRGTWKQRIVS
ncbi:multidrug transporter MatE [candidate division MSBL1 archaeon SCGC-AAA259M10]|uniref:Multidrug-efflux transporter n=5 Tax=candidate division MSBL1 TaxID=215777 RepID=A0A656YX10_9EURY|nr:multidrug transporter MatE [candidate division MSBL1 archaeon SCGC-AAA259E22]KXA95432.1 multidrug transporter MatE [candidate division MSBL1 archaeon SCGC-AAA259I07]KXA98700.1 multidrug transporter MatE [candidate division MSBL1 archaeon SCGC-AAA259J03]KXB00891.1 multidrug transporter MatE [candidate division MSBL1 archaeon SCGC-AAA259M10]